MSISSSQGRPAEWHASVREDGKRLTVCPVNADVALAGQNEHWIGDLGKSDADKFNEIFAPTIAKFNAKQKRDDRKMGPESSKPERQKSYYEGIKDGTFCHGVGDMQEQAVYETVLQIGNKDDNGITDSDFDMQRWYALKKSGHEAEASAYALAHLNSGENIERTKRILHRATDRIAALDPEHLIVLRADLNGDEPCGTLHVHIGYVLRATGYKTGMEERVGSVKALAQMGFTKQKDTEYGITQLHERFKDIVEEEMIADAQEYGYEPIRRKAPTGEQRKRSDVDVFRELAAERSELEAREAMQDMREELVAGRIAHGNKLITDAAEREEAAKRQEEENRRAEELQKAQQEKLDAQQANTRRMYAFVLDVLNAFGDDRRKFASYGELKSALETAVDNFTERTRTDAAASVQAARQEVEREKALYTEARRVCEGFARVQEEIPATYREWAQKEPVYIRGADGRAERYTIAELWDRHLNLRQQTPGTTPEEQAVVRQADAGLSR